MSRWGWLAGVYPERHDTHQHRTGQSKLVAIRVPIDRCAARTRHPNSVALDAAVPVAAAAMLVVESPKIIKQGEHRAVNSYDRRVARASTAATI